MWYVGHANGGWIASNADVWRLLGWTTPTWYTVTNIATRRRVTVRAGSALTSAQTRTLDLY